MSVVTFSDLSDNEGKAENSPTFSRVSFPDIPEIKAENSRASHLFKICESPQTDNEHVEKECVTEFHIFSYVCPVKNILSGKSAQSSTDRFAELEVQVEAKRARSAEWAKCFSKINLRN